MSKQVSGGVHRDGSACELCCRFGLGGILVFPGVVAAQQRIGLEARLAEFARHTGAGSFVGSRTVGDDAAVFG